MNVTISWLVREEYRLLRGWFGDLMCYLRLHVNICHSIHAQHSLSMNLSLLESYFDLVLIKGHTTIHYILHMQSKKIMIHQN